MPVVAVGAVAIGLTLIGEAARHAGAVPLGRPTDDLQVVVGAAFVAAGTGLALVQGAIQGRIATRALVGVALGAGLVLLGMPYLERAFVGTDPGYVVRTFAAFEWSPAARFVLFPALRDVSAMVAVLAVLCAGLRKARQAAQPSST